jgi:hypothetical protein
MLQQRKEKLRGSTEMSYTTERRAEHWMQTRWRPLMAIQYMITCLADFVVFPLLWSILQYKDTSGVVTSQWVPITLQQGGFYHLSMGAILGISAWGRTKEKITGTVAPVGEPAADPAAK